MVARRHNGGEVELVTDHPRRRAWPRRVSDAPNAEGSPLKGYVEHPAPGAQVERRFQVAGWHAWDGEPVAAVVVDAAGTVVRAQASAASRDDVAADHGATYLRSGWVCDVDLSELRASRATLQVTVFPAKDHVGVELEPFEVALLGDATIDEHGERIPEPNAVVGRLEVPAPGEAVALGPLVVSGWATTTDDVAVRRVAVSLGPLELGPARIALGRLDVAATTEAQHAPLCGFELLVDLSTISSVRGVTELRATVEALDGTVGVLAHDVVVEGTATLRPAATVRRALEATPSLVAPFHLLCGTHDLGIGGAQLWLDELLDRSGAGRDFPCTVVALAGGALAGALEARGVEVHVTSPLPVGDATAYEGRLEELSAWLAPRPFTAALVNTFRAFPLADLAERRGLPTVWSIHESFGERLIWTFDHPGVDVDPHVRGVAADALARAGAVVFESAATMALYRERAADRCVVVPYGVDVAALDRQAATRTRTEARAALGIDAGARVLLSMGTIEPRKGQGLLTEAFAAVAYRHRDAVLCLVGDLKTPYSRAIAAAAARAGLQDRVRLEPVTDDAVTWYLAADALVGASDVESLPRSVLDAMALGLPVVETPVFGLGELLTDSVTGLLFEPGDLAAATDALDRLLDLPAADLARIASAGRDLVQRDHDAAGYVADVVALLQGLQRDPGADPTTLVTRAAGAAGS